MSTVTEDLRDFLASRAARENLELTTDRDIWKAECERLAPGYDALKIDLEQVRGNWQRSIDKENELKDELDTVQSQLAALREELAVEKGAYAVALESWKRADARESETQQRLADAERRNAAYAELLRSTALTLHSVHHTLGRFHDENRKHWCGYLDDSQGAVAYTYKLIDAALNPNPEAASHDE